MNGCAAVRERSCRQAHDIALHDDLAGEIQSGATQVASDMQFAMPADSVDMHVAAADQTPLAMHVPAVELIASNEPRARKPSNRMPASQEQLPFVVTFDTSRRAHARQPS